MTFFAQHIHNQLRHRGLVLHYQNFAFGRDALRSRLPLRRRIVFCRDRDHRQFHHETRAASRQIFHADFPLVLFDDPIHD